MHIENDCKCDDCLEQDHKHDLKDKNVGAPQISKVFLLIYQILSHIILAIGIVVKSTIVHVGMISVGMVVSSKVSVRILVSSKVFVGTVITSGVGIVPHISVISHLIVIIISHTMFDSVPNHVHILFLLDIR